jgi:hypothetical protein
MREIGHPVKESRMVACRGGRGLVGFWGGGGPGKSSPGQALWRETGSQIGKERWEVGMVMRRISFGTCERCGRRLYGFSLATRVSPRTVDFLKDMIVV